MNFLRYPRQSIKVSKEKKGKTFTFATLVSTRLNVNLLVELPEGEDENEWLATNAFDFFTHVNVLYGALTDCCSDTSCPVMNAGSYDYLWMDGVKIKKPKKVTAPEYVSYLMEWIQAQIEDETIFPTAAASPFPAKYKEKFIAPIFKRLSRVYGHIYYTHKARIKELDLLECLDTSFTHFMAFVQRYELITEKKDLAPLTPLLESGEQ